ncbi:hypothetical protein M9H77_17713 [Catharanthus roseus]|uniref:Uncharacterized protein n=1 Tax=Catharanthus roseus TaxID=4058 RepID=A0ACC0B5E2_CATRO|nr:hypothetical protein M9H77_17713 [Catharanthus roseus]
MTFDSVEDANAFYMMCSRCVGFSVRKGDRKIGKRITRYRKWHCDKECYRLEKWLEKEDRERNHKAETRVKYGACFRIKHDVKQEKAYKEFRVNGMLMYETRVQKSAMQSHVQLYGYGAYAVDSQSFHFETVDILGW